MSIRALGWICLAVAFVINGCSSSDVDPRLVPVSGKVTYSDRPVAKGWITFSMQSGNHTFSSILDSEGGYTLMASADGKGALPGDYHVSVTSLDEGSPPKPLIPKKYLEFKSSGLTATVPAGGGVFNFDLKN